MRYLLNRLIFFVVSLWAAVTINFILPRLIPGNPAEAMFAKARGTLNPNALKAMELEFGISHQPMIVQYGNYLKSLVTGHWGLSFTYYPTPVTTVVANSLPWTVFLVGIATVLSVFLGTFLGILISWRRGGVLDGILPPVTMFFQAAPYFWMALLLLFVFGFKLNWFPMSHGFGNSVSPGFNLPFLASAIWHGILPGLTIFLGSLSGWLIGMRNNMMITLGEDYIVFAEAKGVSTRRLMFSYAARNAFLPQVTGFAIALGNVVSGSILTEVVFSYPGIGNILNQAVLSQDYPLIQASFLIIAVCVLIANLLVDILYIRLDPRVRTGGAAA